MEKQKEFGIIGNFDGIDHSVLSDEKRNKLIAKIAQSTLYTFQDIESMISGLSIEEIELIDKASEMAGFEMALYSYKTLKNSNIVSGNAKKLNELVGPVPVVTFKERINNYLKRK